MRKIVVSIIFALFFISLVSAFEFDNTKSVPSNFDMYKDTITIRNSFLFLFPTGKVADVSLISNTEQALISGKSIFKVILYEDYPAPITSVEFLDKSGKKSTNIKNIKWRYLTTENYTYDIPQYETICSNNPDSKNATQRCVQEIKGYKTESSSRTVWKNYAGQTLTKGTYYFELTADKQINTKIDFIPELFGVKLQEFAWWDSSWINRKEINITFENALTNFPKLINITKTDSMNADYSDLRFVDGACSGTQDTELVYDFDSNETNSALFWVLLNSTVAGNNQVCMYYNNSLATTSSDPITLWKDTLNATAVYHFSEVAGDTSKSETGTSNLTQRAGTSGTWTNELIDGAVSSTGMNSNNSLFNFNRTHGFTVVDFINFQTATTNGRIWDTKVGGVYLTLSADAKPNLGWNLDHECTNCANVNLSHAYSISAIVNQTSICYVNNGTSAANQCVASDNAIYTNQNLSIGESWGGANTGDLNLMELQIYQEPKSLLWLTEMHQNINFSNVVFGGTENSVNPLNIIITLTLPSSGVSTINSSLTFNSTASVTPIGNNITNATLMIWDSSHDIYSTNFSSGFSGSYNETSLSASGFGLGTYDWNYYWCGGNSSNLICNYSATNNTFNIVGFEETNQYYKTDTLETEKQYFEINITRLSEAYSISAKLYYNGSTYDATTNCIGVSCEIYKIIDTPINVNNYTTENRTFFWMITTTYGGISSYENTTSQNQSTSFINLQLCNETYSTLSLNFTIKDQTNNTKLNESVNRITYQTTYNYWIGDGLTYKNYSLSLVNSSDQFYNYSFCIFPYNESYNFKSDMDLLYSADGYSEDSYYLRNANLTNVTSNIDLLLLQEILSTKFYVTVKRGVSAFSDAIVTVQKYFIGDGIYKTTAIKLTDNDGSFADYLDLDRPYRFIITKEGAIYGIIEKQSTCSVAPCEITLQIIEATNDAFSPYYDYYSYGVLSNLTYNSTDKIVTYTFIDTTGITNYFRLEVTRSYYNDTQTELICNNSAYSSAGTLTCNVSNYEGNFFARGYISRRPEKLDQVISFVISAINQNLGLYGIFFSLGIIITIVMAGATISGGNPRVILFLMGASVFGLKITTILPFSWIVVSIFELIIIYIIWEIEQ